MQQSHSLCCTVTTLIVWMPPPELDRKFGLEEPDLLDVSLDAVLVADEKSAVLKGLK